MRNVKEEVLIWVHVVSVFMIWVVILCATDRTLTITWGTTTKLPDAITIYLILSYVFTKWLWRWSVFKDWLVPFPDLQGTWQGEVTSKWTDPSTGKIPPPVSVVLVITQTFSSLRCVMFTRESESVSTAAQIEDTSGITRLNYNYANRPKANIRERSAVHDGAASLRVISTPSRALEGEYWTSRCTAGEVKLKYLSKALLDDFPKFLL
jgi:hypothetical protein